MVLTRLVVENGHQKTYVPMRVDYICTQNILKLHFGLNIEHNWEDLHNHLKRTCIFVFTLYTLIQWFKRKKIGIQRWVDLGVDYAYGFPHEMVCF